MVALPTRNLESVALEWRSPHGTSFKLRMSHNIQPLCSPQLSRYLKLAYPRLVIFFWSLFTRFLSLSVSSVTISNLINQLISFPSVASSISKSDVMKASVVILAVAGLATAQNFGAEPSCAVSHTIPRRIFGSIILLPVVLQLFCRV